MELQQALRLQPGQVVSFTGAGGKTSALRLLLKETPVDIPVLITTTTHLGKDQLPEVETRWVDDGQGDLPRLVELLRRQGRVLWTGPLDAASGKWTGATPERVDRIKEAIAAIGGLVLVEADGARQKLIKAPAEHEPVIPSTSDLVVPVANAAALGRELNDQIAHRPDRIAQITGAEIGEKLSLAHLSTLLTSGDGGLKGTPEAAEIRVLLNGVRGDLELEATDLAQSTLRLDSDVQAVILARTESAEPVLSVNGRIAGIVLAAGSASRMGELKQVRQWRGQPLVWHVCQQALAAGLAPLVVVIGEGAERVRAALTGLGVEFVENEAWPEGQSTSMQAGLEVVADNSEAAVFLLADMPMVKSELIDRLVQVHQRELPPIVAPRAEGRYGNPVLFDRALFGELTAIRGDQGGKAIFGNYEIRAVSADRSALVDVDKPEDWERLD